MKSAGKGRVPDPIVVRGKFAVTVLLAGGLSVTTLASAQSEYYLIPSVAVVEGHDDNLFFSIDNAESDLFTRVSPALEGGYDSTALNWHGRYSFDAESYKRHSTLDSNSARRFADASVEYHANERLLLSADASYTKTNTPMDIGLGLTTTIPGLLVGRADAERTMAHPSLEYRFSTKTTGNLSYTFTHDKLPGAVESDIHEVGTEFASRLSDVNVLTYGYIYRKYNFDAAPGSGLAITDTNKSSQTPWIGLRHQFGPSTSFTGKIGPRIYDGSARPYALASLQHSYINGEMALAYERNETTLLGQIGRVESETISATFSHRIGRDFEVELVPGYGRVSQQGGDVKIQKLAMRARYKINEAVMLTASYDLNLQRVGFVDGRVSEVSRNVIMLGITFTLPRPNHTASR